MKTLLITGGAGFIGGTFVRRLLQHTDWRLINLDALTYAGSLASIQSALLDEQRHVFVHGDIRDRRLVADLLTNYACSAIVHFAAETHVDHSIHRPHDFADTNVMGTLSLLDEAKGYWSTLSESDQQRFRFVHISTDEVYGSLGQSGCFTESSVYAPNSPYSASKAASDHFARAYFQTYGLPTLVTHSSNNYGPYQYPDKLIPLMILNAVNGKRLPVYGDGQNVRDWIHVEDHCDAIQRILDAGTPGETYNVGGNCELSNLELVHMICDAVDRAQAADSSPSRASCRELIQFVTDRPGHDFRYALDSSKIEKQLGWTPNTPLELGLQQTIDWYLANTGWLAEVRVSTDPRDP